MSKRIHAIAEASPRELLGELQHALGAVEYVELIWRGRSERQGAERKSTGQWPIERKGLE